MDSSRTSGGACPSLSYGANTASSHGVRWKRGGIGGTQHLGPAGGYPPGCADCGEPRHRVFVFALEPNSICPSPRHAGACLQPCPTVCALYAPKAPPRDADRESPCQPPAASLPMPTATGTRIEKVVGGGVRERGEPPFRRSALGEVEPA